MSNKQKRTNIHIHQSSLNKFKQFMNVDETYNDTLIRLIELEEEAQRREFHEKEYLIEYSEVERLFKVRFNSNGINDIFFWDAEKLEWDANISAWKGFEEDMQKENIVKYLIKFIENFLRNQNNMILLDAMGSQVVFDSVVISRI